jgi:hypothetical protein
VLLSETVILAAGQEVIFYPMFQCELSYILYYWPYLLAKTANIHQQNLRTIFYAFKRLKYAHMNALTVQQRIFAEKKYMSHKRNLKYFYIVLFGIIVYEGV